MNRFRESSTTVWNQMLARTFSAPPLQGPVGDGKRQDMYDQEKSGTIVGRELGKVALQLQSRSLRRPYWQ